MPAMVQLFHMSSPDRVTQLCGAQPASLVLLPVPVGQCYSVPDLNTCVYACFLNKASLGKSRDYATDQDNIPM
jgi:hypothetical protein